MRPLGGRGRTSSVLTGPHTCPVLRRSSLLRHIEEDPAAPDAIARGRQRIRRLVAARYLIAALADLRPSPGAARNWWVRGPATTARRATWRPTLLACWVCPRRVRYTHPQRAGVTNNDSTARPARRIPRRLRMAARGLAAFAADRPHVRFVDVGLGGRVSAVSLSDDVPDRRRRPHSFTCGTRR